MRKLLVAIALASPLLANAQGQPPEAAKSPPATKLEAFSARTGVVLIKGYSNLTNIQGMGGRVSIDVREFRDASNPKSAQYGVAFSIKETSRLERENVSFVDEDEIDSLIRGLEYISKIDRSVTGLSNFEAVYATRGDLSLTVFNSSRGEINFAVSSGRVGRTTAFLKLTDADQLRNSLGEAKKVIAAAKAK